MKKNLYTLKDINWYVSLKNELNEFDPCVIAFIYNENKTRIKLVGKGAGSAPVFDFNQQVDNYYKMAVYALNDASEHKNGKVWNAESVLKYCLKPSKIKNYLDNLNKSVTGNEVYKISKKFFNILYKQEKINEKNQVVSKDF
ncbi:MAG: hypothetical protein E7359_03805 [Clostridiales bacterium]|nr:hypothetical protein [Clostridiales bacterium]